MSNRGAGPLVRLALVMASMLGLHQAADAPHPPSPQPAPTDGPIRIPYDNAPRNGVLWPTRVRNNRAGRARAFARKGGR
jgi:hypothetical protein